MAKKAGKGYHHGNLRAEALRAVAETIREVGPGQLSVREVARRVGVSNRATAHHFGDKAGMLTEFAADGYELLAQSVVDAINAASPPNGAEMLQVIGRAYVKFALEHPEHFDVMFRLDMLRPADPRFTMARETAYGLLTATIKQCQEEGRLGGRSPELVAVSAWSLVHGLAALWLSGRLSERIGERDPHRLAARVSRLFVDSILISRNSR